MEYTKLGNSDVTVSRICMGCMGFGDATKGHHSWILDADRSREIIRYGFEYGVTFYDTAIGYADGTSEEYVGRALRSIAGKREDYQIATKFLPRTDAEREAGVSDQQHVMNNLDVSLRHLGLDYVDLYICHMWDYHTDMAEILEGMNEAVKAGKARSIGISNCYAYQLAKMNDLAEANGWAKFVSIQSHYNLGERFLCGGVSSAFDGDRVERAVDLGQLVRRERDGRAAEVLPQTVDVLGAGNRHDPRALREQPAECDLCGRDATLVRQ